MKAVLFVRNLWRINKALVLVPGVLTLTCLVLFAINTWVLAPDLKQLRLRGIGQRELTHKAGLEKRISLAKRLQKDSKDFVAFRESIKGYDRFSVFIGDLFDLAGKAGLRIDKVRYEPKDVDKYSLLRYDLSFSVSGDYGEIKKFVFLLEQSEQIIVIEEVALIGANKAGGSSIDLNIRLSTYFSLSNS